MGWTAEGAAKKLARRVGGMWPETRQKLEDLSECGDSKAENVAKKALAEQRLYDNEYHYYED